MALLRSGADLEGFGTFQDQVVLDGHPQQP